MKTNITAKKCILLIGVLTPPMGGMGTSLENIINSDLKTKYNLIVLDITGKRTRYKGSLLGGIIYQMSLIFKLSLILIKNKPCIAHVQMTSFFYFYRRAVDIMICKLFGLKIILHLRSGKFIDFFNESSFLGKNSIKFILKISDRIVALSRKWYNFLATITNPKRITIIPNGVKCADFYLIHNKKKELGYSNEQIFIIFMGSIGKRKGIVNVLEALPRVIQRFNNVTLLIFGPSEESDTEIVRLRQKIKENNLEAYVKYMETTSDQEKIDYYLSSDIFVLPSYAENFPNAVLEAMAAGLPVVVSDVGAIPEVIEDGVDGFIVKPGDVNSIAEKIIKLAEDRSLRESMGKRNLEHAKRKYDMLIIAEKIDMLYRELL